MSMIPFHPAPGFGDLMPGEFVVPQNPLRDAGTPLVPSTIALTGAKPYRVPHIGELMPGKFVVPQNPLITTMVNGYSGVPSKPGGCGCAGSSGGGCGCHGGMGALDMTGLTTWLQASSIGGIPNWVLAAGGVVAAYMIFMPGGSEYRKKSSALRSQYRGYRRASRGAGSALQGV